MYQYPGEGDTLELVLHDFPVEGYTPPGDETSYYLSENGRLFWDNPPSPGKYAAAVKTREWKPSDNPIYNGE